MASSIENDLHVSKKSGALDGVKIAVCSGGGIAAVQLPKLLRELRRHGAIVRVFPTQSCLEFIGKTSLEWASAQPVIDKPSGLAEHICEEDCVLVFPATADLLAKSATGLCTEPASTLIQSALGQKKSMIFSPTMHDSLFEAPATQNNIKSLQLLSNVSFIDAKREEGKQKSQEPVELASEICHVFNQRKYKLQTKDVHITLGGTYVPIDTVRTVSNHSTGHLGKLISEQLYNLGFNLYVFAAQTSVEKLERQNIKWDKCESYNSMKALLSEINPTQSHALLQLAAISDFEVENPASEKIQSGSSLSIQLKPVAKLLDLANLKQIPIKFACKLTHGNTDTLENIKSIFMNSDIDLMIWNRANHAFGQDKDYTCTLFKKKKGQIVHETINGKENLSRTVAMTLLSFVTTLESNIK